MICFNHFFSLYNFFNRELKRQIKTELNTKIIYICTNRKNTSSKNSNGVTIAQIATGCRGTRETNPRTNTRHAACWETSEETPLCPGCWKASTAAGSARLQLEYTLSLQVGVCVVAPEALGVLAHVAALGARLRRRDQPVEQTLVATDGSLR